MPLLQDDGSGKLQGGVSRGEIFQSMYLPEVDESREPGDDIGQIVRNAGSDFRDSALGIGVIGSAMAKRAGETMLPPAAFEWDRWGSGNASDLTPGAFTLDRNALRPSDVPFAAQVGGDIVGHYWNDYISPLLQGNTETPLTYAKTHPLNTVLDVVPVAGAIGKVAKAGGVTAKLAKAGQAILDKVPGGTALQNNITSFKAATTAARDVHNAHVDQWKKASDYVKEAWDKIPEDLRGEVLEAGELRNLDAYQRLKDIPEVKEFWKRANETNGQISDDLVKSGAMTPEELLTAKYGPATRALTGMSEQELHSPQGMRALRDTKALLDGEGVEPTYMGILFPKTVSAAGKLERTPFANTPNLHADNKPSFLREREAGNRVPGLHEFDAYNVWKTRYLQGLQYLKLREYFYNALRNPAAQAGSVAVDVHKFFKQLGTHSGMSPQQLGNFLKDLPQTINVPKAMELAMKNILHEEPSGAMGKFARAWATSAQIFKTFTLGLDMFWATNQTLQNGMIAQVAMWRSPRDVAASFLAHAMAFDPKIRAMLPKHWMTDAAVSSAGTDGLMGAIAKFAPPLAKYMDTVFNLASTGDNYWRSVIGLYSLMRGIEAADPAARVALTKAFNIAARQQQIDLALAKPQVVAKAGREIEKWMGQYDELTARQWATPRSILPFFLWYKHAYSVAMAMTTDTPVKNALLHQLAQRAPGLFQQDDELSKYDKENSSVLLTDPEGVPYEGPNGGVLTKSASAYTPFSQAPELTAQIANMIFNQGKPFTGVVTHPGIQFAESMLGINPSTGESWKNPAALQSGGEQFDPFLNEEIKRVSPPPLHLMMRALLPRQEAIVRAFTTPGKMPSDFPGVPKMDRKHQEGYEALDPVQQGVLTFTKQLPHEQGFTSEESDRMDNSRKRKVRKLKNQQRYRWEDDDDEDDI